MDTLLQERAIAWARSDAMAAQITRTLVSCPAAELIGLPNVGEIDPAGDARGFALGCELEDLALGCRDGKRLRRRDLRDARRRLGFDPDAVMWPDIARALLAERGGAAS